VETWASLSRAAAVSMGWRPSSFLVRRRA